MRSGASLVRGAVLTLTMLAAKPLAAAAPGMPLALEAVPCSGVPGDGSATASPASMALALNALPPARVQALATALERLANRLERRLNPFYVEVGDPEEQAEVERLLDGIGPMLSAASALAAGRWRSSDGDLCVQPVRSCRGHERCYVLDGGDRRLDPAEARARFLAWPLAAAVLLRAPSDQDAAALAVRLRTASPATSRVALALSDRELHALRRGPAMTVLSRQALRVAGLVRGRDPRLAAMLDDLAAAGRAPDPLRWLQLPRGGLLVVPRLGVLASLWQFVDEVLAAVHEVGTAVDWLYSPTRS